nr:unnamed protein product [Callosobruchus chinensis]
MFFSASARVVCYVGTWAAYRSVNGKFDIENINPKLCTHLIYTFVGLNQSNYIFTNYFSTEGYERFNALKKQNPSLKTLIAIGGWNEGATTYSHVLSDPKLRTAFVKNAVEFVKMHGFNGLDIDIEYPGQRGGAASDKITFTLFQENFSKLIKELREAFNPHGFLLSAAVPCTGSSADISYQVPELSKYLDFINVMTYDIHGSFDGEVGHVAPLYASSVDKTSTAKLLNVDASITAWIQRGASPQKLTLGIPFYGRTFTLKDPKNVSLGAPITGPGAAGLYSKSEGTLAYNEIVELQQKEKWTVVFDAEQKVPHAYHNDQWVGYDDPRSISIKVGQRGFLNTIHRNPSL